MTELQESPDSRWIQTYTGKAFRPLDPRPEDVCIEDIAHALSLTCRFAGHCKSFYSVAQHSIIVSQIVPPRDSLWGLMHDAAEAYLADIAGPVKREMPDFVEMENRILVAIAKAFDMDWPMPKSIKIADNILLSTERRDLMRDPPYKWISVENIEPLTEVIYPGSPGFCEGLFLEMFREYRHTPNSTRYYKSERKAA